MLTKSDIVAAIHRNEVNALNTKFDAHMRGMFRKSAASYRRQLKTLEMAA